MSDRRCAPARDARSRVGTAGSQTESSPKFLSPPPEPGRLRRRRRLTTARRPRQRPGSPSRSSIIARPFSPLSRFPSARRRVHLRPEAGLGALGVDPRTLVVIKTHSFAHDRDWLNAFLGTSASYIGLLGPAGASRTSCSACSVRMPTSASSGRSAWTSEPTDPSRSPSALSAELLAVLARQQPGHLRERRSPSMPAERTGPVAGVVLAAGTSTRMGRNKLFLELDGERSSGGGRARVEGRLRSGGRRPRPRGRASCSGRSKACRTGRWSIPSTSAA